jgi:hypothetical protein
VLAHTEDRRRLDQAWSRSPYSARRLTSTLQHTSCGSDFAALNCWPLIFWSINFELVVVIQDITWGCPNIAFADFIMLQIFVTTVRLEAVRSKSTLSPKLTVASQCKSCDNLRVCGICLFPVQHNSMLECSRIEVKIVHMRNCDW